jgi:hypothetical protein
MISSPPLVLPHVGILDEAMQFSWHGQLQNVVRFYLAFRVASWLGSLCPNYSVQFRQISSSRRPGFDNDSELVGKFNIMIPWSQTRGSSIAFLLEPTPNRTIFQGIEIWKEMAEHFAKPGSPDGVV